MTNGIKKSFDIKTKMSGRILMGHSDPKSLLGNSGIPDLWIAAGPSEVGKGLMQRIFESICIQCTVVWKNNTIFDEYMFCCLEKCISLGSLEFNAFSRGYFKKLFAIYLIQVGLGALEESYKISTWGFYLLQIEK